VTCKSLKVVGSYCHSDPSNGGVPMATLVRPRQGRVIAGVCAGLAARSGISVTLIRVVFVIFALTGAGELVYLLSWVIIPKAPE
jgi:phage shock protein C